MINVNELETIVSIIVSDLDYSSEIHHYNISTGEAIFIYDI